MALHHAAQTDDVALLDALLHAFDSNAEIVDLLLERCADPNARTLSQRRWQVGRQYVIGAGASPLDLALVNRHDAVAARIVAAGGVRTTAQVERY
ncbi:hypothetical protein [Polyangium jinanense]|uniref:Ankyrin repeat domain-containing protein n=1 Tax=Polyangium jinanense TaxID=2829994 RepID=A0A9X4AX73_9BACT|nr:hypothetical protein [Polyangium jinanense]MDC3957769.1 hypothetical protein [Polyangium jinanense]MDC3961961.1 hypothetical protein [Polyangium jinanense]MDC3987561.1 hypothetical protein [Polyangium jinanense]